MKPRSVVRRLVFAGSIVSAAFSGVLAGQEGPPVSPVSGETGYQDVDCPFLGPQRERFLTDAARRKLGIPESRRLSATTRAVSEALGIVPGGSRTYNYG